MFMARKDMYSRIETKLEFRKSIYDDLVISKGITLLSEWVVFNCLTLDLVYSTRIPAFGGFNLNFYYGAHEHDSLAK
jgi:hypothetical protein